MAKHGDTERYILNLFEHTGEFEYNGLKYKILKIGKPKPSKGECKTDIYILAKDNLEKMREFKISIKQNNADFLENKISYERALEIFGPNASQIIQENISKIKSAFENDVIINAGKFKRTEENCIKIGWKFEFVNKLGGEKSGIIELSEDQKIDVYSGSNLSLNKRNCMVKGELLNNSGIANFIIEVDNIESNLDYYIHKMLPIEEFAIKQSIYFACKAINYRYNADKWDGDRPLSVFCDWRINPESNKIEMTLVYDQPLMKKANEIGNNIRAILDHYKIKNFIEIEKHLDINLSLYK